MAGQSGPCSLRYRYAYIFGEIIYNILFQAHFAARFCATKGHSDELYHFLGECHGTEGTLLAAWAIQSGPGTMRHTLLPGSGPQRTPTHHNPVPFPKRVSLGSPLWICSVLRHGGV